jgi:Zn-finger nucleic acid-binding protein
MLCPADSTTLVVTERESVEIDYCPECRGVWLDRGELEKLLRRDREDDYNDEPGHRPKDHDPRRRKKKGWLSEILEFGG